MFKNKLKENRQKLNLTQEQLAGKIFVSREAVSKWEQGRGLPEKESLSRLAALFGMKEEDLLTEADLHEAVDENANAAEKGRKRIFVLSLVSCVLVTALASTLIAFAFIYHSSLVNEEDTYTLSSALMGKDAEGKTYLKNLTAANEKKNLDLDSSSFKDTAFYDESETYLKDPWSTVVLREGDTFRVETSERVETNLYGKSREGVVNVRSFHLISHPFEKSDFLYGVGVYLGRNASFSETGANCAYAGYSLGALSGGFTAITDLAYNASSPSFSFFSSDEPGKSHITTSSSFLLDSAKALNVPFAFAFLNGAGEWKDTYKDMERGVFSIIPARSS